MFWDYIIVVIVSFLLYFLAIYYGAKVGYGYVSKMMEFTKTRFLFDFVFLIITASIQSFIIAILPALFLDSMSTLNWLIIILWSFVYMFISVKISNCINFYEIMLLNKKGFIFSSDEIPVQSKEILKNFPDFIRLKKMLGLAIFAPCVIFVLAHTISKQSIWQGLGLFIVLSFFVFLLGIALTKTYFRKYKGEVEVHISSE